MIKRLVIAALGAAALFTQPALSQEEGFQVEPLTAEQQARMPMARQVAQRVLQDEALSRMGADYFGVGIGTEVGEPEGMAVYMLAEALGYAPGVETIAAVKAERALTILDPAWRDRQQAENAAMEEYSRSFMMRLEPLMRETMSELFAIRFTSTHLQELDVFFQTETGQAFARNGMNMTQDPRMMTAVFANPAIWENMDDFDTADYEAVYAAAPPRRSFADLSPRERAELAALTGLEQGELQAALAWQDQMMDAAAEAAEAAADAVGD